MNILGIISPSDFVKKYPFGGTSGFVENIAPHLHFPVKIYGLGYGDTVIYRAYSLASNVQFVPIFKIGKKNLFPRRVHSLAGFWENKKTILNDKIDILYIHSPECALPFVLGKKNVPVIFHQHGSANPIVHSKYRIARNPVNKKIFDWMLKLIHKRSDWIIVIDPISLEQVKANGVSHKATLLMNAIDTALFKPDMNLRIKVRKKYGLVDEDFVILFAGRLEEVKRADLIIKGISEMGQLKQSLKLFIAGDGTQRKMLEILASKLQVSAHFLGHVDHANLPAFYNMSDVLVLPSKMEGVPMVILEAVACGTPVMATNVGGIPQIINEQNGILFDNANPKIIADLLLKIMQKNFTRNAVSKTVKKYGTANSVKVLESIFFKVLEKKHER